MPTTYGQPEREDVVMVYHVMAEHHNELYDAGVSVGVLLADNDKQRPLKAKGGGPALARIRILPLWLRALIGGCDLLGALSMQRPVDQIEASTLDVLLEIDRAEWLKMTDECKMALVDHMVSRLDLCKEDGTTNIVRDDLGRPKLKGREGDWVCSDGYIEVVERWGDAAPEFRSAQTSWAKARAAQQAKVPG